MADLMGTGGMSPAPAVAEAAATDAEALLGPGLRARLGAPLEASTGLPNAAYVSVEFLALENERVLARSWALAGFGHAIPDPGDAAPVEVAGKPLILVRDRAGSVRAFHNVCRHRGARLLDAPCRAARLLRCPNHHWAYGLDGRFRNRPHFHGPERHDTHAEGQGPEGLVAVRCATWHDLVFVNIDGGAPGLDAYIAPVARRVAGYDLSALRHAGVLEWELRCNWKLVHENFIEPYHVFAVHPGLLEFGPMSGRRASEFDGACFFNDYQFPRPQSGRGAGLPYYPGIEGTALARQAIWFHLFPTLTLQIFPDQMAVWELIPLAPDRTLERIHVYLVGDAARSPEHGAAREQVLRTWRALNEEDVAIIERMQAGRESPGFDGGVLSPYWDGAIRHYARLMLDALTERSGS